MRDLLSKLDALVSETALKDKEDLAAKHKALDDLEADPVASSDPEISAAIDQRRADLEKEAETKGFTEDEDLYQIGDDFGISFSEDFEVATEIVDIAEDGIVIDLDETAMSYLEQNGFTFEEVQLDEEKQKGLDGKACWKGYRRMGTKMKGGKRVDNCVKESDEQDARRLVEFLKGAIESVESLKDEPDYDPEDIRFTDDLPRMQEHLQKLIQNPSEENMRDALFDYDTEWRETMGEWAEEEIGDLYQRLLNAQYNQQEDQANEAKYQGREVPLGKPMKGDVKKSKVYVRGPKGNVVKVNFGDKKMRIKKSNPNRRKSFRARHNCKNPGPRWKARYWSCRAW